MCRFAILLTVVVVLTGTTSVGAITLTDEMFKEEFMKHVTTPCMAALGEQSGTPHLFADDSPVDGTVQWALFQYRFGKLTMDAFNVGLAIQRTKLSGIVKDEPWNIRQAWYAVAVEVCKKKLSE